MLRSQLGKFVGCTVNFPPGNLNLPEFPPLPLPPPAPVPRPVVVAPPPMASSMAAPAATRFFRIFDLVIETR